MSETKVFRGIDAFRLPDRALAQVHSKVEVEDCQTFHAQIVSSNAVNVFKFVFNYEATLSALKAHTMLVRTMYCTC